MGRLDERGERAFLDTSVPVNTYPQFVRYMVKRLKTLCPTFGKRKLADSLCWGGMNMSASTALRCVKSKDLAPPPGPEPVSARKLTSKYPNHIWNVDLTVVPTSAGFWVRWFPFSQLLHWPFDDPAYAVGNEEKVMEIFRRVRDEIKAKLEEFVA